MNITTCNISQINLNVGENLPKLNACYKTLVRTQTAPLHIPSVAVQKVLCRGTVGVLTSIFYILEEVS